MEEGQEEGEEEVDCAEGGKGAGVEGGEVCGETGDDRFEVSLSMRQGGRKDVPRHGTA